MVKKKNNSERYLDIIDRMARIETKIDSIMGSLKNIEHKHTEFSAKIEQLENTVSKHGTYINWINAFIVSLIGGFVSLIFWIIQNMR